LARGTIEQLRDEIIQLIAKHLAIHEEDIQIRVDRTSEGERLIASIPLQITQRPRAQMVTAATPKKAHSRRRRRSRPRPAN
jgi:septum formation topological specificity factor MinE